MIMRIMAVIILVWCGPSWAAEISIPGSSVKSGQSLRIPIIVDKAQNLAGVKLKITYDSNLLIFQKASKSKPVSNMMQIVNSKTPGKLVIVMASGNGINVKNAPLIILMFKAKSISEKKSFSIKIKEAQLMDAALKEIPLKIMLNSLTILPAG